ncbi:MAG TPA: hypothetical protein VK921_14050 [Anditalea sp.]|nr:hypothetical protein [Anditalea sp.]
MKKILLFSLILFFSIEGYCQEPIRFKRGYIGISLGPTIHTGTTSGPAVIVPVSYFGSSQGFIIPETPTLNPGDVGLTINLIDGGYTIWKNWGIALKWQGGAYVDELDGEVLVSNFGMIMFGPMYSVPIQKDLILDFKLRTGRMYSGYTFEGMNSKGEGSYYRLGMEGSATLRYNFAPKWAWINNLEYQNQFAYFSKERISRINISSGIAFRF